MFTDIIINCNFAAFSSQKIYHCKLFTFGIFL